MNAPIEQTWDAIVVGSGANGGVAAWKLCAAGWRVLVLDAGREVAPRETQSSFLRDMSKALYRHWFSKRQQVQKHHPTYWATNPDLFIDDVDNPYTTPDAMPFRWIRARCTGGRTHVWDGVTPRMSDFEFHAARQDGYGIDWPLSYADLEPHYAQVEEALNVWGHADQLPQLPDGVFGGHKTMTPGEEHLRQTLDREFDDRRLIISRGLNAQRGAVPGEAVSRITSTATTIARAERTGRMSLRTNAVVSRILVADDGRSVTGVEVIDARTKQVEQVRASVVFLCASTLESVRILLNSKSKHHRQGLGGNSDCLGRYVMDHSAGNVYFSLPSVRGYGADYEFSGCASVMIPRWQNLGRQTEPYLRGFGIWGGIQRMPVPNPLLRDRRAAFGFLCARAEVLPHRDNRVLLHPTRRDTHGIPILHIECEWKPEDMRIASAARRDTEEMVRAAGGVPGMVTDHFYTPLVRGFLEKMQREWRLSTPGMFVHELGGARMGARPEESVLDPNCQVWGVENLYVTDGSCWPTSGWQNPTLTEMAITSRAVSHAVSSRAGAEGLEIAS